MTTQANTDLEFDHVPPRGVLQVRKAHVGGLRASHRAGPASRGPQDRCQCPRRKSWLARLLGR